MLLFHRCSRLKSVNMKLVNYIISIVIFPGLVFSAQNILPKSFKQCKIDDKDVSKCLQKAVPDAFRKMKDGGIPSLGVLPLEPLQISEIKIEPNPGRPVSLKLHFKNIKMYGIPDTTLLTYDARMKEARLVSNAFTPRLWFEADYTSDGKVLVLPLKGKGRCNVTMFELKTFTDLVFKVQKKNGETYWSIQNFITKFSPKKVSMYFEGLISDATLSNHINHFLNENWQPIFDELKSSFELAFGAVFKEITHRVFDKVPLNKIFTN